MPELPEVETSLRGIKPLLFNQIIQQVKIINPKLRWPISLKLPQLLKNQPLKNITRRGKYLLFYTASGAFIIHLGMSGSLRIVEADVPREKHDHIEFLFSNQLILRLNDPRRFGAVLWGGANPLSHPRLIKLGPEPLSSNFNGSYLAEKALKRRIAIKSFIMNSHIVVGVGNIYAAEALFCAGVHPSRTVDNISLIVWEKLAKCIKKVLTSAINQGGTTLKNYVDITGKPGYFKQKLMVYGREDQACQRCHSKIQLLKQGNRSSFFCGVCQKN